MINALGNKVPAFVRLNAQRLILKDPKVVNKFLSNYKQILHKYKLIDRILALQGKCPTQKQTLEKDNIEYEKIDKLRMEVILFLDKRYRKLRMGNLQ